MISPTNKAGIFGIRVGGAGRREVTVDNPHDLNQPKAVTSVRNRLIPVMFIVIIHGQ